MASVAIIDLSKNKSRTISRIGYPQSKIEEVLPFRVMFTNIGLSSLVPGIGLQVIGINNYIL